jgi:hypothetical protein
MTKTSAVTFHRWDAQGAGHRPHFAVRSPKGEGRSASNHYGVMSLDEQ